MSDFFALKMKRLIDKQQQLCTCQLNGLTSPDVNSALCWIQLTTTSLIHNRTVKYGLSL